MRNGIYNGNSESVLTARMRDHFFSSKGFFSLLLCLFFLSAADLWAAKRETVFFGITTDSSDTSTISLTEKLFFKQFEALDSYRLEDRRDTPWNDSFLSDYEGRDVLLFAIDIHDKNTFWLVTLNIHDMKNNTRAEFQAEYEDYYKILMDSKNAIDTLLSSLKTGSSSSATENAAPVLVTLSMDSLAGTWNGEPELDKIVILKSGRGFVVFKNGASMTIELSIISNQLLIKQTSNNNASYFPDLPKNVAQSAAATANPITWSFIMIDQNTLTGKKTTLHTSDSGKSAYPGTTQVTWTRQ